MSLQVLNIAGRPVVGLDFNASLSENLKILKELYPENTFRKRAVKLFVRLVLILNLGFIFFKKPSPLLLKLVNNLKPTNGSHLFVRFHSLKKKSRCYCFYLNSDLDLDSFAKIAFDTENSKLLKKESQIIKGIKIDSPVLIANLNKESQVYGSYGFSVEGISNQFKVEQKKYKFIDEKVLTALQGDLITNNISNIKNLDWWRAFERTENYQYITKKILRCKKSLLCRVHGDMGSENILSRASGSETVPIYVVDWERYHKQGPYLTDALGFWLGFYYKDILSPDSRGSISRLFFSEFIPNYSDDIDASFLALAYLVSVDFTLATYLLDSICRGAYDN